MVHHLRAHPHKLSHFFVVAFNRYKLQGRQSAAHHACCCPGKQVAAPPRQLSECPVNPFALIFPNNDEIVLQESMDKSIYQHLRKESITHNFTNLLPSPDPLQKYPFPSCLELFYFFTLHFGLQPVRLFNIVLIVQPVRLFQCSDCAKNHLTALELH